MKSLHRLLFVVSMILLGVSCGAGSPDDTGGSCQQATVVTCAVGTTLVGDTCVSDLQQCGEGTLREGSQCVAMACAPGASCGTGTALSNGVCVASLQGCGTGTTMSGSQCVASIQSCGVGTVLSGSQCVATGLTCGAGTTTMNNQCTVNLAAVCSTDTSSSGATCVGKVMCGTGTLRMGDVCNANLGTVCGVGTTASNGKCVPDSTACGPGTTFANGQCGLPVQVASLQTFTAATNLKASHDHWTIYLSNGGYRTAHRLMFTDLSQGNADVWVTSEIDPIGQGVALHLEFTAELDLADESIRPIVSGEYTNGRCDSSLAPGDEPSNHSGTYVNFFTWNQGSPAITACALGGSVKAERLVVNGVDSVRLTINTQFNDNTTWVDKVFVAPYH